MVYDFFFWFFAVFTNLSLIEYYFRALILKSTSRSLGPLHNYSNIFFFIGFIFTINYAKIYTILVNIFILYQKKKEFACSPLISHTITWSNKGKPCFTLAVSFPFQLYLRVTIMPIIQGISWSDKEVKKLFETLIKLN